MIAGRMLVALTFAGTLLLPAAALAQDATPTAGECVELDEAGQQAVIDRWHAAGNGAAFPEDLRADFAPDYVAHVGASEMDLDGWLAFRAKNDAAFPDERREIAITLIDGPFVVQQWTRFGTHAGEWDGVPPSGEKIGWDVITVFRFECGKIAETWSQSDNPGRTRPLAEREALAPLPAAECATPVAEGDAEALAQAYWDGVGDTEEQLALVAPDVRYAWAVGANTVGQEAMAERIAGLVTAMPDHAVTVEEMVSDGEFVATRWRLEGAFTGPFQDAGPTGEPVSWSGHSIFQVQCGRIVAIWTENDAPPPFGDGQ